ncbi:DUF4397 domain-containing protein [Silvibacterium dinghuense]|uniref:DUF4397 domain-containing protein n=2 Tax=Silvibacterium dinghuense TaxID=1560006 RepID=A0A4Q1SKJ4_9BACT|nr:DUF4397 domain-containing protein [Silvibacterium dinghuense]
MRMRGKARQAAKGLDWTAAGWVILAASGALTLTGCESVASTQQSTLVRLIDASSNALGVDLYANGTKIVANQGFPTFSNYADVSSGTISLKVYPTGKTTPVDAQASGTLTAGGQYSLLLTDSGTGEATTLLTDQATAAPSGDFALRIVQEASTVGAVDVYLTTASSITATSSTSTSTSTTSSLSGLTPIVSDLAAGSTMSYTDIADGTYEIVIVPTGTTDVTTTTAYIDSSVTFSSGSVRTLLIANSSTSASNMTAVMGDDLD